MRTPPLDGLDLNLLTTLRALLGEESVTRAATELGTTQPSVSRALATLREAFDDPLLVRTGRGMTLTPYGAALRAPLEQALAAVHRLRAVGDFDPATATRRFRLLVPDVLGAVILTRLRAAIDKAPGIGLDVLGSESDSLGALLGAAADVVVQVPEIAHADLFTRRLPGGLSMSVVIGPRHPQWRGRLSYASWLKSEHVQLLPAGQPEVASRVDALLAERGDRRNIRLRVAYLSSIADVLESSAAVSSLPTATAEWLVRGRQLRAVPHPMTGLEPLPVRLTWHATHHHDEGQRWFREVLAAALTPALRTSKGR